MLDWGGTTEHGFTAVSRTFLRNYVSMGITMGEAMLIIQILDFKWRDAHPFPKVETLAQLTGMNIKTIRLYISSLRAKRMVRTRLRNGRSNEYDFTPLFDKLKKIANATPVAEEPPGTPSAFVLASDGDSEEPTRNPTTQGTRNPTSRSTSKKEKNPDHDARDRVSLLASRAMRSEEITKPRIDRLDSTHKKPVGEYNVRDVETVFSEVWRQHFKTPPPMWTPKWRGQMKTLLEHYGGGPTTLAVFYLLENWESLRTRWTLNGYPSVPLMAGYQSSLFPLAIDGERAAPAKTKPNARPQWTAPTDADDEVGWG